VAMAKSKQFFITKYGWVAKYDPLYLLLKDMGLSEEEVVKNIYSVSWKNRDEARASLKDQNMMQLTKKIRVTIAVQIEEV
jgi:hypothetical protein